MHEVKQALGLLPSVGCSYEQERILLGEQLVAKARNDAANKVSLEQTLEIIKPPGNIIVRSCRNHRRRRWRQRRGRRDATEKRRCDDDVDRRRWHAPCTIVIHQAFGLKVCLDTVVDPLFL